MKKIFMIKIISNSGNEEYNVEKKYPLHVKKVMIKSILTYILFS